jgi:hypothetical protein
MAVQELLRTSLRIQIQKFLLVGLVTVEGMADSKIWYVLMESEMEVGVTASI